MANTPSKSRGSGPELDLRDDSDSRESDSGESDEHRSAHGRHADKPSEIPPRGWIDVAKRVTAEAKADNLALIAGGVAFFGLLAIPPALAAAVSIYGLVSSPEDVARQMDQFAATMPGDARNLLNEQLTQVVSTNKTGLGIGALVGLVLALWGASSAMKHLIEALDSTYDEEEGRTFVQLRLRSLLLTGGALLFLGIALLPLAVGPSLIDRAGNDTLSTIVGVVRWPILAALVMAGLAVLYRYAPDRDEPKWQWTSWGAVIATVGWVVASLAFSFYASNFGRYNKTFGSMAAVVLLMMWLFITALSILLGAEINAELEHQTEKDSTKGREQPRGTRDAYVADHVGAASS